MVEAKRNQCVSGVARLAAHLGQEVVAEAEGQGRPGFVIEHGRDHVEGCHLIVAAVGMPFSFTVALRRLAAAAPASRRAQRRGLRSQRAGLLQRVRAVDRVRHFGRETNTCGSARDGLHSARAAHERTCGRALARRKGGSLAKFLQERAHPLHLALGARLMVGGGGYAHA